MNNKLAIYGLAGLLTSSAIIAVAIALFAKVQTQNTFHDEISSTWKI